MKKSCFGVSVFLTCMAPSLLFSCTTVFSNEQNTPQVVARTMDLYTSDSPMLVATPRGTTRVGDKGEHALSWKSKYGALVVTAFHSPAVSDGINERGLAAHLLYLTGTEYPSEKESARTLTNAMWAQYILDNFSTVEEALKGTESLRIVSTEIYGKTWPVHLTMEDATGDSAVIEFIGGKRIVYHGPQFRVMTNEPAYSIQLANLKRYKLFGGTLPLPGDTDPLSRFVRVSTYLKTLPHPRNEVESIAGILSVIRTAMVPYGAEDTSGNKTVDAWVTRWATVADLTNKIYYFNSTSTPNIVWIDLNKLNFAEGAKTVSIDPTNIHLEGDITP